MALDTEAPRSRRTILAAALGGLGGYIASALGRPAAALAANGDTVTVGGSFAGTSPTAITSSTGDAIQATNTSTGASGLYGHASAGSGTTYGVFGRSDSTAGTGVAGVNYSASGLTAGVYGQADSAAGMGVSGHSASGWGVYGKSSSNVGVFGESTSSVGVAGRSSASNQAAMVGQSTGHGTGIVGSSSASIPPALSDTGVYGYADGLNGAGVLGLAAGTTAVNAGVEGQTSSALGAGVKGWSKPGVGVIATSDSNYGLQGASGATAKAAILGWSIGNSTAVEGFSGLGAIPTPPAKTGVYGYAAQDASAVGVKGESTVGIGVTGLSFTQAGVMGTSVSNIGIFGASNSTTWPAILGTAAGGRTGVQGFSGANGAQPAAPPKTGVFGYAAQDATAVGVKGQSTVGIGVLAAADSTGVALQASGRVKLSRSGKVSIAAGKSYVDVTVTGGLSGTPLPFANLQTYRSGVFVAAIRPNYPRTGVMRIYLNKVASSSYSTPVSWCVLG